MMTPLAISAVMAAMLLLLGSRGAHGHMIMNTPTPYNLNTAPLLQVNPLSGDHYPFPCHNHYSFAERTAVEAGGATLVNFTGGAQHGGGSCQFSITYDEPVDGGSWNKSAKFKTIYTIIGGCPAEFTDETRNLPPAAKDSHMREDGKHCGNDNGVDCIRQFMIPIPKFLKNGPATFAWTWFNKIGNREMYMNCAPITITGGTGDQAQIDELPDIFVANYHNDPDLPTCITGTSADKVVLNFPIPGKFGRVLQPPLEPAIKPANYCTQIPPASLVPTFLADPSHADSSSSGSNTSTATTANSLTGSSSPPTASSTTSGSSVTVIAPVEESSSTEDSSISGPALATTLSATLFLSTTTASAPSSSSAFHTSITAILNTTNVCTSTATATVTTTVTVLPVSAYTTTTVAACLPAPLGPGPVQLPKTTTTTTVTVITPATTTGTTGILPSPSPSLSDGSDINTTTVVVGPRPSDDDDAVPCDRLGKIVCLAGGSRWGVCDQWGWAVPREAAQGTVCYWGRIVDAEIGRVVAVGAE
ncbi:hypothetical protein VTK26DRAFT_2903 [Humicola hyalothermophila]